MRSLAMMALAAVVMVFANCTASSAAGNITVEGAWISVPPGGDSAAAFGTIHNAGAHGDRLVRAATRRASMAMLHNMTTDDGVVSMRTAASGLAVAAGQSTVLSPQGSHIMLMGIAPPLQRGETVQIELTFQHAGRIVVPFVVADQPPAPAHAAHK